MNEQPMKCSIGSVAILMILSIFQIACVYAYFNADELSISSIYAIGLFVGGIQVSNSEIYFCSLC